MTLPRPVVVTAVLLVGALGASIVTYQRMHGMDAGPGTDLGGLGWYLGIWVTMMAAMMLPSVAPMVLVFARISRDRERRGHAFVPTWVFVAGYLAAWTAYGLAAYGVFRALRWAVGRSLDWHGAGAWIAGGAVLAAGLYELTPLKRVCLRHCRGPLHFVLHGWRDGRVGALRTGVEHGAFCVGCCWGLMLALFALGVMSLFWMAVIAVVIFAEKLLPAGETFSRIFAVALVAGGIWVAAAPASVPGLVQPDSPAAQRARERMMHMSPAMKPMKPEAAKPAPGAGDEVDDARGNPALATVAYRVHGTYLESCNCDAPCPCRRIDGRAGGRSTHGICEGALSWSIEEGSAGDLDLAGLGVVLATRYSDDEERSPWTFALFVDERGDPGQREALGRIFSGALGGTVLDHFPWAWKVSNPLGAEPARIEIDHTLGRGWFRAGESVSVHVSEPYAGPETITCVIPGHERTGRELVVEELHVGAGPLAFAYSGVCAYESSFVYIG